jgi:tRNA nucleotidyltransferase (CCA-adding enzyme)
MVRAMKRNSDKLKNISFERIRDELDKMLMTGAPHRAIKLLKITGVLEYVIPEFKASYKMTQNKYHKHDVFAHSMDVLSKTKPVLVQRLMGLFHDIGKTVTRSVTPTGVHFYGHEYAGAKMVEEIMRRLKYPNELIKQVVLGVNSHMRLKSGGPDSYKLSDKALRKFKVEMGDGIENILDVIHADNISHSEASSMPAQIENIRERLTKLSILPEKPKLPINGEDLKGLGIKPGPIYSEIMSAVLEKWYENPYITKEEALKLASDISKKS